MAKYFAGTRIALYGKNGNGISWQTTLGTITRYDSNFVDGCLQFAAAYNNGAGIYVSTTLPIGMDAASASTVYVKFDWLSGSISAPALNLGKWPWVEFLDSSANTICRLVVNWNNNTPNPTMSMEYWNGSTWVIRGNYIQTPNIDARMELQVRFSGGASGTFQVWRGSALYFSETAIPLNITGNIAYVRISNPFSGISYGSQFAISDFDMRGYKISSDYLTSAGTFNDGTGVVSNTSDSDTATAKSLPANLDKYSGTHAARSVVGTLILESVSIGGILRAGSPVANARTIVVASGVSYSYASDIIPAPILGYEWRGQNWASHPTLGSWTIANFNSSEKGHEART